jgi:ethanolamine transporter EutH
MLGPLPTLHRFVLVLAALVVGIGIGFWLGAMPEIALNLRVGVLAGTAAGLAAAFVLVHDFHQRQARPARERRRPL